MNGRSKIRKAAACLAQALLLAAGSGFKIDQCCLRICCTTGRERLTARAQRYDFFHSAQFFVLAPNGGMALAGVSSKACFVDDLHASAPVVDQALLLQLTGEHRDARALHTEHLRQMLLREQKFTTADRILRAQ